MTKEFDNCEQYALKTLELDSTAKEAHLLLGKIYLALPLDQSHSELINTIRNRIFLKV